MRQPQGFGDGTTTYADWSEVSMALKQAARCWNQYLNAALLKIGYHRTYSRLRGIHPSNPTDVIILESMLTNFLSFGNTPSGLKSHKNSNMKLSRWKEEIQTG